MPEPNPWIPPVTFYFRVDFQRFKEHFQASFMEVNGLSLSMSTGERKDSEYRVVKVPDKIIPGNITLKSPLFPLSAAFTKWVGNCFSYVDTSNIQTYDLVIKLLGPDGKPVAGWLCSHAYPISWNLNTLDAGKGELAIETVILACNRLKRITNI